MYPEEPMKLLLLNGNTLVEIEDKEDTIVKKLVECGDRNNYFNTFYNMPHLQQQDIGDSIF